MRCEMRFDIVLNLKGTISVYADSEDEALDKLDEFADSLAVSDYEVERWWWDKITEVGNGREEAERP